MKLNKEQKEYIKEILIYSWEKVSDLFYNKYKIKLSREQINGFRKYYKIKCLDKNTGQFKKGKKPHNKKQIGDEFLSKNDGYVWIKVAEPDKWVVKHRYIYEKHYGKIPKGYRVVFLDQNKNNCDINNLMLVKSKDILVAKNLKFISTDKEITKTGIMIAQLINKKIDVKRNMEE